MLKLKVSGEQAQKKLGAALAAASPPSCVIYLVGDLGAGKTTFARGFIQSLGHKGAVKSPTYALMEPYELPNRKCYHFDLYRLADAGELEYLGIRDLLQTEAILLVEWPEKGEGELPSADLVIEIAHAGECRQLQIKSYSEKGNSLLQHLDLSTWNSGGS
ncbi:tRNA (adenosine(37)-N6)-threonylcarbamoyltransferase complex ATPase subunit type 1 TsaE [Pseudomonadota bacterium]